MSREEPGNDPGTRTANRKRISNLLRNNRANLINFASFIVLRLLALGVFAASVPIFISRSSEADYGVVAIALSIVTLNTAIDVGVGYVLIQIIGRHVARNGRPHPRVFNRLFWFSVFLMAAISTILLIGVSLLTLPPLEKGLYSWMISLLPLLAGSGIAASVYQAHGVLFNLNASRFIFEIGKGLAVAVSGFWLFDYRAIGPILFVIALLRLSIDLRVLSRRLGYVLTFPKNLATPGTMRLVRNGLPSAGAATLGILVNILDKPLIAWWLTKQDVAYYSLAFDVTTKAYLLVHAINSSMFTIWLHQYAQRRDATKHIKVVVTMVSVFSLCYYLPIAIWSEQILGLWINDDVGREVAPLLRVMTLAGVLYLFSNVFEVALLARARAHLVFRVVLVATSAYLLSLLVLPKSMGLIGFMWAYVVLCFTHLLGMLVGHFSSDKWQGRR